MGSQNRCQTAPLCQKPLAPVIGAADNFVICPLEAGATESSNFAPAENPHGYVYAVSPDGDWMWGQFFYNVSYAVSSIDGIILSQNGTFLNCLGQANSKPIIMNLNKAKGQI